MDTGPAHQSAAQLQGTIEVMRKRINELERITGQVSSQVLLQQPYMPTSLDPTHSFGNWFTSSLEFIY